MSILFKTIDDFSAVTAVPKSLDLGSFTPHIRQVQDDRIKKLIGGDMLTAVLADYHSETPTMGGFIEVLQRLVGSLALLAYKDQLNVMITEGGLQQNAETDKTMAASMWRTNKFELSVLKDVDVYYNQLLEFLDANETDALYAAYLGSDERLAWKNTFIYSPAVASKYVSARLNFYALHRMGATINRMSRRFLKPVLGEDLYLELLERNKTRVDWAVYEPLREFIEEFVINMSLYEAVPEMRMGFDEEGTGIIFGRVDKVTKFGTDTEGAIFMAQKKWRENAEFALSSLKNGLVSNADSYPLYTAPAVVEALDIKPFNSSGAVGTFF